MYGCIKDNGQEDNTAPTCTLHASPTVGTAPLNITFILGAYDPNDSIAEWSLDIDNDGISEYFGTGNPLSTQNHTYDDPGIYSAKFTVTDTHGDTGTNTITINVTESPLVQYSSKVSINPIMSSVSPGQRFCIEILVDSKDLTVRTVGIQLTYSTAFTLKSFAYENLLSTNIIEMGNPPENDTSGFINYAVSRTDERADPVNGTLATICFTSPSIPDTYNLFLHDVILIDESNNIITGIGVTDGIVLVPGS
jgi:PKD repeat protein